MAEPMTEDDLATFFGDDAASQEVVIARAKAFLDARRKKEVAEEELKRLSAGVTNCELELIRAMDAAGVKSLKIEHAGQTAGLSQTQTTYYSLPAGTIDEPDFMEWLKDAGGSDILKHTIHHSTFSAFCKELVSHSADGDNGLLHPAVKVAERRGVMVRKG